LAAPVRTYSQTIVRLGFVGIIQDDGAVLSSQDSRRRDLVDSEPNRQVEIGLTMLIAADRRRQVDDSFDKLRLF
jgi:hypothetical protein